MILLVLLNIMMSASKALAKRFRSEVKRKLKLIKEIPRIYTLRYGEVRFALLDVFPYAIHFSINEEKQIVQIHAILCQFENPYTAWQIFSNYPPIAIIFRFCS